ncbi:MAG: hypothetical protein LBQ80_02365 [Clostridium sp.]|jgi:hypothetical protein|nr:hypothetical protein [Clostridium sp.]
MIEIAGGKSGSGGLETVDIYENEQTTSKVRVVIPKSDLFDILMIYIICDECHLSLEGKQEKISPKSLDKL